MNNLNENKLVLQNIVIESRASDNFVNATQLCKAGGKLFGNWYRLDTTQALIKVLEYSSESICFRVNATQLRKAGV